MNASKENARNAVERALRIRSRAGASEDITFIQEFLAAAEKRLPSEAAIAKDKQRKKKARAE